MCNHLKALLLAALVSPVLSPAADYQTPGVVDNLPVFYRELKARTQYPLSWLPDMRGDFSAWRQTAREKVVSCLLTPPPPAPWNETVLEEEDRGSHIARKIVFNLTGDSRVLAYLTIPKGPGPFPAVLLLHDHGGKFDIGKEKVIRPWNIPAAKIDSAQKWSEEYYGGRFLGDALAERGYVCFATDVLNWSDRGGGGYEGQQKLASNLMHLGMSFAGLIAWEDQRAAEFLATRPEVDASRVAAMGLSMGSFRTWQVCALSDRIRAGVAICWMSTVDGLMVPGNNQTKGDSAYTMLHAGLLGALDYPDVAGIACPKPMLFFNGLRDHLFPVNGVRDAYKKMHAIWRSQGVEDRLLTRLWDVDHLFNAEMQDTAFAWLDQWLRPAAPAQ